MIEKGKIMHDKRKNRNNDLHIATSKTTYCARRTPQKPGMNWGIPEEEAVSAQLMASVALRMVQNQ